MYSANIYDGVMWDMQMSQQRVSESLIGYRKGQGL